MRKIYTISTTANPILAPPRVASNYTRYIPGTIYTLDGNDKVGSILKKTDCLGDPHCPMDAHGIRHAKECGYGK